MVWRRGGTPIVLHTWWLMVRRGGLPDKSSDLKSFLILFIFTQYCLTKANKQKKNATPDLARQLHCSDFNSEIWPIQLANLQKTVFSISVFISSCVLPDPRLHSPAALLWNCSDWVTSPLSVPPSSIPLVRELEALTSPDTALTSCLVCSENAFLTSYLMEELQTAFLFGDAATARYSCPWKLSASEASSHFYPPKKLVAKKDKVAHTSSWNVVPPRSGWA